MLANCARNKYIRVQREKVYMIIIYITLNKMTIYIHTKYCINLKVIEWNQIWELHIIQMQSQTDILICYSLHRIS